MDTGGGVLVLRASPGSPASEAGLRTGDVITAIDGERVLDVGAFLGRLRRYDPGDVVTFGVRRGDDTTDIDVPLGERLPEN